MHETTIDSLPPFLRDMLAAPPRHGEGVHQWLFATARQLHAHLPPDGICRLLASRSRDCGRRVSEREIRDAVDNSRACAWMPHGGALSPARTTGAFTVPRPPKPWPDADPALIASIADADPAALESLRDQSWVKVRESLHDAASLLERLFPGNPLLCVGTEPWNARPHRRACFARYDAGNLSHIVPSPMTARRGRNKDGDQSARCLGNTGPRHYLVTEFDQGDRDTQAAAIRHLSAKAPLVMVVDSAGKSLHAWWHCEGVQESDLLNFFRYAVRLGADPATWTRCQLVRMPLGWRADKGRRQLVHYFNPDNTAFIKRNLQPKPQA